MFSSSLTAGLSMHPRAFSISTATEVYSILAARNLSKVDVRSATGLMPFTSNISGIFGSGRVSSACAKAIEPNAKIAMAKMVKERVMCEISSGESIAYSIYICQQLFYLVNSQPQKHTWKQGYFN